MKAKLLRKIRSKVAWKYDRVKQQWLFLNKETLQEFKPLPFHFYIRMGVVKEVTISEDNMVMFSILKNTNNLTLFKTKNDRDANRNKKRSKRYKTKVYLKWLTT